MILLAPVTGLAAVLATLLLLLVSSFAGAQHGEAPVLVEGVVKAPSGYLISHVRVELRELGLFALTDREGRFVIHGSVARNVEQVEVVATYAGFDPVRETVAAASLPASLVLIMSPAAIQEVIRVEAPAPTDEALLPSQELGFLDIVATAGTNADPLYAAQTLPGVVKVDEGSGLFVRGGDNSEVAIFLDRTLLDHAFRNETPTGGYFGTVDAFELSGFSLSAGGFPARYGNALSAVLQLTPRDRPARRALNLGLGLAALSLSLEQPVTEQLSFRAAGNRLMSDALVDVNDSDLDFHEPPSSIDYSFRLDAAAEQGSQLRLQLYSQDSTVGTELEDGSFVGVVDGADEHQLVSLLWQRISTETELSLAASHSRYRGEIEIGVLKIDLGDDVDRARLDLERDVAGTRSRTGLVWERIRHDSAGRLPQVAGDFGGVEGTRLWATGDSLQRSGAYVELERVFGRWALNLGARYDDYDLLDQGSLEPRAALSISASRHHVVRLAAGTYRQSPEIETLTTGLGESDLRLMRARHTVVGWEWSGASPVSTRLELYDKRYARLPLENAGGGFDSLGHGRASGVDFFVGYDGDGSWDGWFSYSFLDTERLYTPWQDRGQYPLPTEPFDPDFDLPHSTQLVVHRRLPLDVSASLAVRLASGRPFTPVVEGEPTAHGYVPVYGDINSERAPGYRRVDASFSRPFAVGRDLVALVYVGINDLLDRQNFYRYVYSPDFSSRMPARTAFGRTVYFGVTFQR